MDSEVQRDGRILDLIDDAWREDKLPYEDVAIPLSFLCAHEDVDVSLHLPLTSCRISSELECPCHRTILGLASGRSRIVLSLCFPFMLLVFELVSQLVCRTERISLILTVAVLVTLYFRFLKFH
ncbi:anaphase-promoting complex subunit 13 isoform 1-T1 [Sarcoramphus papa]